MFEEGTRLKAIHGPDRVYDFSLGNPDVPPPPQVLEAMAAHARGMSHGYMANAGYPEVRAQVAAHASKMYGVDLAAEDIIMTCGAGGGLNVVLKAILDPGDEVVAIAPYFVEYGFYAENHGGRLVAVACDETFLPDAERIRKALTARTKALIINSPNNPSGRVYPRGILENLAHVLADHPQVLLISDEPYRGIVYDGHEVPSVLAVSPNTVVVTSASKELSLAGQRIGYIALSPQVSEREELLGAMVLATRILGFVNAPALMQRVYAECLNERVDVALYARRRDALRAIFDASGLSYAPPEGTFYLFVKSPLQDETVFCQELLKERILAVPGRGFGYPGYVRFAYCVDERTITGASPGIGRVMERL